METTTAQPSILSKERKLQLLNRLLEKAKDITSTSYSNPAFKDWKIQVERTFIQIFGETSIEVTEFRKLKFYSSVIPFSVSLEDAHQHVTIYKQSFETTLKLIRQYVDEINEESDEKIKPVITNEDLPKIKWQGKQKELAELFTFALLVTKILSLFLNTPCQKRRIERTALVVHFV
jgi:hypothetical protein